jgi:hypothetical protein
MKYSIIILVSALFFALSACNGSSDKASTTASNNPNQMYACSMHPEVIGKKGETCSKCGMELTEPVDAPAKTEVVAPVPATDTTTPKEEATSASTNGMVDVNEIVSIYFQLKNAFVTDNSSDAGKAGKAMETAFKTFNTTSLSAEQKKSFAEIADDAKEHGEHIGANVGNIEHQREHFEMLSKDVYDLIKTFGTTAKVYHDFCPMYNNKKGAYWLSEAKEIKNPYYGSKMLTCGSVKEEIK